MWDPSTRQHFQDRVDRLTPSVTPNWGKMNPAGMLAHLNDSFRMATGELSVKGKWLPFRYPPFRQFVVYTMPIPKGAPTAPELIARCGTAEFEPERHAFHTWMERLGHITSDTRSTASSWRGTRTTTCGSSAYRRDAIERSEDRPIPRSQSRENRRSDPGAREQRLHRRQRALQLLA